MAEEKATEQAAEQVEKTTEPSIDELKAQIAALTEQNQRLKASNDNASSQAAEFKKKWRDTLSEQERKDAEIAEQRAAEKAELEAYKLKERVSGYTAKLMSCGYDATTAEIMAKALPENVSEEYFNAQKAFIEGKTASIKNDLLKGQSGVGGSKAPEPNAKGAEEELRKYFGL